jgi:sigma-B regulation protein RsbU (phosphoserine phosphatase)
MLPREPPRIPWLDVATATLPATEVGGDYYDFFVRPDEGLVVVVGDVAGHGLGSGLVLSGVRSGLYLLMEGDDDLPRALERLNRMVRRTSHSRMRVSLLAVEILPGSGEIRVASAGHPPLLIREQATGNVLEVDLPALPLGSHLGGPAHAESRRIAPGDVMLLYTDGLFEAAAPGGEPFGIDRIRDVLAGHEPAAGSEALKERLLRELWSFRGDTPQKDDITLVALTIREVPGTGGAALEV